MPIRRCFDGACRSSSISQQSSHVESPSHDALPRHSGLPGLRLVGVRHSARLAFCRVVAFAASASCRPDCESRHENRYEIGYEKRRESCAANRAHRGHVGLAEIPPAASKEGRALSTRMPQSQQMVARKKAPSRSWRPFCRFQGSGFRCLLPVPSSRWAGARQAIYKGTFSSGAMNPMPGIFSLCRSLSFVINRSTPK